MIATEQVHVIKLECEECSGRGWHPVRTEARVDHTDCPHCTNGMREEIIWRPDRQPEPAPQRMNVKEWINKYSPYQSGDTIPTPDGNRIAGEVRLKRVGDIFSLKNGGIWTMGYLDCQEALKVRIYTDTYLCIAESRPL